MDERIGRIVAALGLIACGACGDAHSADRPPNLVLVSFDTTRADHLGCYGYERETSPNVDRLAREGVLFENAYSHSPKTAPSHMSIFTGLLPDAHAVKNLGEKDNHPLQAEIPTLAEILQEAGYRTAAHTAGGHVTAELGFGRGFEAFETGGGIGATFERGVASIEGFDGEPFFVFLHTYEVHDPYVPPQPFRDMFADEAYAGDIIGSRQELIEAAGKEWSAQHEIFWSRVDGDSIEDRGHLVDLYDAGIRFADDRLGHFLEELDDLGELDRTWIVFLSDHGEEFQEHGGWMHETLYQEVLHVPLIVRPPAAQREGFENVRCESVVGLVDVLPTLLDLLVLPKPASIQGRSLFDLIRVDEESTRGLLSHWPRQDLYSLRRERWKLHWKLDEVKGDRIELYDLTQDPAETVDLAQDEPGAVSELTGEIEKLREWSDRWSSGAPTGDGIELTQEQKDELRALGYLDDPGDQR